MQRPLPGCSRTWRPGIIGSRLVQGATCFLLQFSLGRVWHARTAHPSCCPESPPAVWSLRPSCVAACCLRGSRPLTISSASSCWVTATCPCCGTPCLLRWPAGARLAPGARLASGLGAPTAHLPLAGARADIAPRLAPPTRPCEPPPARPAASGQHAARHSGRLSGGAEASAGQHGAMWVHSGLLRLCKLR